MLKADDLRDKTIEDLNEELVEQKDGLLKARMSFHARQLDNVCSMKTHRKNIAKIKTIIKEKELEGAANA